MGKKEQGNTLKKWCCEASFMIPFGGDCYPFLSTSSGRNKVKTAETWKVAEEMKRTWKHRFPSSSHFETVRSIQRERMRTMVYYIWYIFGGILNPYYLLLNFTCDCCWVRLTSLILVSYSYNQRRFWVQNDTQKMAAKELATWGPL